MLKSLLVKALAVHQAVYVHSGGWVGHRLLGMPTLLLHTTGRRTGQPRTSALTYGRDCERYLVTASNGGASRPPAWFLNLSARPQCEVQVGRDRQWATARPVLPDDPDYARLWNIVNKVNYNQYRAYQKKTDRPIPVVVLDPLS